MADAKRSAKEFIRHMAFVLTGGASAKLSKSWRQKTHLHTGDIRDRFSKIYELGVWRNGRNDVPASGEGSTIQATRVLREKLPDLLAELKAKTLLDIGCGDFNWMQTVPFNVSYVGVDIVPSVIMANQQFAGAQRTFLCANAITDDLPDADVVLCREVLFHLSFADGRTLLRNIFSKRRSYFITTTDQASDFNADIITGDFRPRNLRRPPFSFPAPLLEIDDSAVSPDRKLSIWAASEIQPYL